MRVVIALGGNAILLRNQPFEASIQRKNIRSAARCIAKIAEEHQVIVTHGNGPQIGLLALMHQEYKEITPYPLDVLSAQTQGFIGYILAQELYNYLPCNKVCAITTQTIVDENDEAFLDPNKFIGPVYNDKQAQEILQKNPSWELKKDGDAYRRVVASPRPQEILELDILKSLIALKDITVICGGGGGIPVTKDKNGKIHGIEAVVDKDRTSALIAKHFSADCLILLTDIQAIETDFGNPHSQKIKRITPEALEQFQFPAGSMGPKIEAACSFVRSGGSFSAIGPLNNAVDVVNKKSGTTIEKSVTNNEIIFY